MKSILILLLIPFTCFSQNSDDRKIHLAVNDSTNLFNRVKIALVKNDFIVKEDGNYTRVLTYPRELKKLQGYSIVMAEISGNVVTLSGSYGLTKINDWGYTTTPKNYKPIVYYRGSKTWKLLLQIAEEIEGQITSYSK